MKEGGDRVEIQLQEWVTPRLVPLAASGDSKNNLSGTGDIDQTYSGFPYGYS